MKTVLPYIVFAAMALLYVLYMSIGKQSLEKALIKCVPTLLAFGYALYGAVVIKTSAAAYIAACGLFVCAIADFLLEYRFIPGVAAFGAAHVCFIAAFLSSGRFGTVNTLVFGALWCVMCTLFILFRAKKPDGVPLIVFLIYAAMLSFMAASSPIPGGWYIVGAALFVISDSILGFRIFRLLEGRVWSFVLMGAYYAALFCLALGNNL